MEVQTYLSQYEIIIKKIIITLINCNTYYTCKNVFVMIHTCLPRLFEHVNECVCKSNMCISMAGTAQRNGELAHTTPDTHFLLRKSTISLQRWM